VAILESSSEVAWEVQPMTEVEAVLALCAFIVVLGVVFAWWLRARDRERERTQARYDAVRREWDAEARAEAARLKYRRGVDATDGGTYVPRAELHLSPPPNAARYTAPDRRRDEERRRHDLDGIGGVDALTAFAAMSSIGNSSSTSSIGDGGSSGGGGAGGSYDCGSSSSDSGSSGGCGGDGGGEW
jgi:hypothetical protein